MHCRPAYKAVWLTEDAIKALRYTLSHVCSDDHGVTLSEAVTRLCNEWIDLGNFKLAAERAADDGPRLDETPS